MNRKKEAIQKLYELLGIIPALKQLNHSNQDYPLWRDHVKDTLSFFFSRDSEEYKRFTSLGFLTFNRLATEKERQARYIQDLEDKERKLKSIIDRQDIVKTSVFNNFLKCSKSRLKECVQWTKSHKISSIIITIITLIAAGITIYEFIFNK